MKRILVLLLFPFIASAQLPGFTIKGAVKGLVDGTQVGLNALNGKNIATGKVEKGVFVLKGSLPGTDILRLAAAGSQDAVELMMGNENITVSGSWNDVNNLIVKGAAAQADFDAFRKAVYPYLTQRNAAMNNLNAAGNDPEKRRQYTSEISRIDVVIPNVVLQFAQAKPSAAASTWALYFISPLFENDIPALENAYAKLQPPAKKLVYTSQLEQFIADRKIGMVGSQALDFTQNDMEGKPVSLSSFKGKYVLVDFWASWCGPCRGENPNVVSAFERYKSKNFTVLGVSLDQVKPNWLKAVKEDNLNWTQVSDLQYWNNAAARLYHIQSIPANLLIDPSGKIIAKNIRGEELHKKLEEVLK